MSTQTDNSAVAGMLKAVYAPKAKDVRVLSSILQNTHPLDKADLLGDSFNIPLIVSNSQMPVWDVAGGTTSFPAGSAIQTVNGKITGFEVTERFLLPFGTAAQLSNGKNASFASAAALKMLAADKAVRRSLEYGLLYGSESFATVTTSAARSGSSRVVTLLSGSFAPGFLSGFLNGYIDDYTGSTKNNSSTLKVTAVDVVAGTLTLTGSNADLDAVTSGDVLYRAGQYGLEMYGLHYQITNTTNTNFYGIDRTVYNYMRGTTKSSTGNFSIAKLFNGIADAQNNGLDGDAMFLCAPKLYGSLLQDLQSARRLDYSFEPTKTAVGTKAIEAVSGDTRVTITPHPFVKETDAMLYPKDAFIRVGASDITDAIAGMLDLQVMSSTANSMELRLWTQQSCFLSAPAQSVCWTGITYAAT
jgi:hypothetical protein